MKLPSISYDRLVSQNMFDCLVLRIKDKKERKYSQAEPIKFLNRTSKKVVNLLTKPLITIYLFNELGEELGTLNMNHSDSL